MKREGSISPYQAPLEVWAVLTVLELKDSGIVFDNLPLCRGFISYNCDLHKDLADQIKACIQRQELKDLLKKVNEKPELADERWRSWIKSWKYKLSNRSEKLLLNGIEDILGRHKEIITNTLKSLAAPNWIMMLRESRNPKPFPVKMDKQESNERLDPNRLLKHFVLCN